MNRLRALFRNLFRRDAVERELDDELRGCGQTLAGYVPARRASALDPLTDLRTD